MKHNSYIENVELVSVAQRRRIIQAGRPVVLYSDGIGDTLMSLPTLRALSAAFNKNIVFLGSLVSLEILRAEELGASYVEREEEAAETAKHVVACDLLITADPDRESQYSQELKAIVRPLWSVGWAAHDQFQLKSNPQLHFADEVFQVASFFDETKRIEEYADRPGLGATEWQFAGDLRRDMKHWRFLAIHCETGEPKAWPLAPLGRAVEALISIFRDLLIVVVGRKSRWLGNISEHPRVIACEGLTLGKSMAIVGASDAFIGIDSGLLHVADLFRVPAVGIFGPTDPHRWGCRFTKCTYVRAPAGNLKELGEQEVITAVQSLLDK
jgi:ADP-heptose:LPS heptosyltransferase